MIAKDWKEIQANIKKKIYHPIYLLMGEEALFIDGVSDIIEKNILTETEKEFNQSILYGRDVDVPTIVSTAKRFPMMANHQVVIVKEAHLVKNLEDLEGYMANPLKSTILVICHKYKSVDKRKGFYKNALKNGVVLETKKLRDFEVPPWISDYVKTRGYKIGEKATQLLADHLGSDLGKVVNEIKKVFISIPKGAEVTPGLIEQNIGISKDFNVFELQKALSEKNALKAFQIVKYFGENPKSNPMIITLAILHAFFLKVLRYHYLRDRSPKNVGAELGVNPYFAKDYQSAAASYPLPKIFAIMSYLREYDLRVKGVDSQSVSEGDLLKELIYKILH